jgi:signal transduction histidine kinase
LIARDIEREEMDSLQVETQRRSGVEVARATSERRNAVLSAHPSLIRHAAIVVASLVAYALRTELPTNASVVVVLGATALLNAAAALACDRFPILQRAWWWSPVLGLLGWATLSFYTGGVSSPFMAGFWLEIALSPMLVEPRRIPLVTLAAVCCLWGVQQLLGASTGKSYVATGFLLTGGALTYVVSLRFARSHRSATAQALFCLQRLEAVESDLDDARTLGAIGEKTAQMTHAVRNAVHSLRGFVELMERPALGDSGRQRALDGLRLTIDRLEELTRVVLRAEPPLSMVSARTNVSEVISAVIDEARQVHPSIEWVRPLAEDAHSEALSALELREVLMVLVQNAAQATGARGSVTVGMEKGDQSLELFVRDEGSGMSPAQLEELFKMRATTKAKGAGFGLYLARRTLEARGGRIEVESTVGRGTTFFVRLPVVQTTKRDAAHEKPPAAA